MPRLRREAANLDVSNIIRCLFDAILIEPKIIRYLFDAILSEFKIARYLLTLSSVSLVLSDASSSLPKESYALHLLKI